MIKVIVSTKNTTLRTMVTQNRVFSMPRRAVNTPPVSAPVNPPRPAPLLCKMTLRIKVMDVIIREICRNCVMRNSPANFNIFRIVAPEKPAANISCSVN